MAVALLVIEPESMFEDLRSDAVGCALNALRSKEKWDAKKYGVRDQ